MTSTSADPRGDHELLQAARAGDAPALEALLVRHQARVWRFGMKMCRNPDDANEVVQDTLIAMARAVRDFRGESSLQTWIYSIARSFCIKRRRRTGMTRLTAGSLDGELAPVGERLQDPGRSPEDIVAGHEIEAALEAAIGTLAPMYREVLVLRDVEGLTAPEVGKVLGLSVEAVKSRLHRARGAVRARLAPVLGVPATGSPGCPDVGEMLSRHLEGDLSADACAEMERHIAQCDRCRGSCDELRRMLATCRSLPGPQVPDHVASSVRDAVREYLAARG